MYVLIVYTPRAKSLHFWKETATFEEAVSYAHSCLGTWGTIGESPFIEDNVRNDSFARVGWSNNELFMVDVKSYQKRFIEGGLNFKREGMDDAILRLIRREKLKMILD